MSQPNPLAYAVEEFMDDNFSELSTEFMTRLGIFRPGDNLDHLSTDSAFQTFVKERFVKEQEKLEGLND